MYSNSQRRFYATLVEILFKDPKKLGSMPFINGDLRQYKTCKGEQLHCAYRIFNKMSSYDKVRSRCYSISGFYLVIYSDCGSY